MRSPSPRLILASTSPYRAELLRRLGVAFDAIAPQTDETPEPNEAPEHLAQRLARRKAEAVAALHPAAVVVGSDQVAVCRGQVMGKPGSAGRALEQLQWQRGHETLFFSAVAVVGPRDSSGERAVIEGHVETRVRWRSAEELTDQRLWRYIDLEKPFDCAGSAKSEGLGISLVASIANDDPTALIGLPMIWLVDALRRQGIDPLRG